MSRVTMQVSMPRAVTVTAIAGRYPPSRARRPNRTHPLASRHGCARRSATRHQEDHVERRSLGSLDVSVVGLGANNFGTTYARYVDVDETRAVVDTALDCGVNFIDTAAVYGDSEVFLGEVLEGRRD